MTIIGNSRPEQWLSYARDVSERPSGEGENAPRAADADGEPELVIPLIPVDEVDPGRRSGTRLRPGQLSALMSVAN
ncbi:hypothetical protein ACW9HQ_48860, partial [Nocardia gipuzkoensis]